MKLVKTCLKCNVSCKTSEGMQLGEMGTLTYFAIPEVL